jgi:branched-chain amino acid transport system substrate-binding protein
VFTSKSTGEGIVSTHHIRSLCVAVASCILFTASFVSTAWSQTEIKVGVILPTTGREAKPGQFQKEGIELAIKQINDQGGVMVRSLKKKVPIKEVFYDDGSDQGKSTSLVERAMSSDDVTAVVGGYSTVLGEAESVMPDRYKTPPPSSPRATSTPSAPSVRWTRWATPPANISGQWWTPAS